MICGMEDWRKGILLVTVHNRTPRGKVEMLEEGRLEQSKICLCLFEGIISQHTKSALLNAAD